MKKLFLILTILGLSTLCANAGEFTVEDSHSRDYLENTGYSSSTIEIIERSHARALGEEYTGYVDRTLSRNQGGWFGKFLRYLDPSLDSDTFMNYDIEFYSHFNDL